MDPDHFMDYDCVYMDQDQTWIALWTMWFVILNFFVWVFRGRKTFLCGIFACFSRRFFKQFYWI